MKICDSCGAVFGVLADYCGNCGTKLPRAILSEELETEKEEHNRIICKSALGHTLQQDQTHGSQSFCTACGAHLPIPPVYH